MALGLAEWNALPSVEEVRSFAENIGGPTELVRALRAFDVIVAMRERTRFPADVIDALPNLKLLVSTGGRNPSIDAEACARRNIPLAFASGASGNHRSTAQGAWVLL